MQPDPVEPVPAVTLQRVDDIDPTAGGEMRGGRRLIEGDRFRGRRPVAQLYPQMAAI